MADITANPSMVRMFSEIDRRLRVLETAPQIGNSSVREGGLTVYDSAGVAAARFGQSQTALLQSGAEYYGASGTRLLYIGRVGAAPSEYVSVRAVETGGAFGAWLGRFPSTLGPAAIDVTGLLVQDTIFTPVLQATSEELWERPMIPVPARKADDIYTVTSGSFIPAWHAKANSVLARYAFVEVVVSSDVGTTGEVRITHNSITSGVQSVASGAAGVTLTWRWDMSGSLLSDHTFQIQARRTGGAGNVYIYEPIVQLGTPDGVITTTGT